MVIYFAAWLAFGLIVADLTIIHARCPDREAQRSYRGGAGQLSPATCGRILALNRRLYGLDKPKGAPRKKKEMPFATSKRHQYWTIDVRYVDRHRVGGKVYVISILENRSRSILASTVSRSQGTTSYLCVLYQAVVRYGSPEKIVTDG